MNLKQPRKFYFNEVEDDFFIDLVKLKGHPINIKVFDIGDNMVFNYNLLIPQYLPPLLRKYRKQYGTSYMTFDKELDYIHDVKTMCYEFNDLITNDCGIDYNKLDNEELEILKRNCLTELTAINTALLRLNKNYYFIDTYTDSELLDELDEELSVQEIISLCGHSITMNVCLAGGTKKTPYEIDSDADLINALKPYRKSEAFTGRLKFYVFFDCNG